MHIQEFFDTFKGSDYFRFLEQKRLEKEQEAGRRLELHHIYLKSFEDGKVDIPENLVRLTTVDHIKAHILLVQSFEQLGKLGHSYEVAVAAVNGLTNLRWKRLTEQEREHFVKTLSEGTLKVWEEARKKAKKQTDSVLIQKYGGCTKQMQTPEAKKHRLEAIAAKYGGDTAGQLHTREAVEKRIQTHIERYGSEIGGCHTQEAVAKRLQTNLNRYGNLLGAAGTEKSRKKAQEVFRERYGSFGKLTQRQVSREKRFDTNMHRYGNRAGRLHDPEVVSKGADTRERKYGSRGPSGMPGAREKCIAVQKEANRCRALVKETQEFKDWYESVGKHLKSPRNENRKLSTKACVGVFLKTIGKTLQDFKDDLR